MNDDASRRDSSSAKRARFDTAPPTAVTFDSRTPSGAVFAHSENAFVTLHEDIAAYALSTCADFTRLLNRKAGQEKKIAKPKSDEHMPVSLRFKFELKSTDKVKKIDEFKQLAAETRTLQRRMY